MNSWKPGLVLSKCGFRNEIVRYVRWISPVERIAVAERSGSSISSKSACSSVVSASRRGLIGARRQFRSTASIKARCSSGSGVLFKKAPRPGPANAPKTGRFVDRRAEGILVQDRIEAGVRKRQIHEVSAVELHQSAVFPHPATEHSLTGCPTIRGHLVCSSGAHRRHAGPGDVSIDFNPERSCDDAKQRCDQGKAWRRERMGFAGPVVGVDGSVRTLKPSIRRMSLRSATATHLRFRRRACHSSPGPTMRYPTPRSLKTYVGLAASSPSLRRRLRTKMRTRLASAPLREPQTRRSSVS